VFDLPDATSTPIIHDAVQQDDPSLSDNMQQTTATMTPTSAHLMQTADGMSMEHLFFSLQHLQSRVATLEQEKQP